MAQWHTKETQMWDNPEGGAFDPADVRRQCKKNSPLLYLAKRTKEGCDHSS